MSANASNPIRTSVKSFDEVRRALDQIVAELARLSSTANGHGASMIGIEDAGSKYTATNVEDALQELIP